MTLKISFNLLGILTLLFLPFQIMNHFYIATGNVPGPPSLYKKISFVLVTVLLFLGATVFDTFSDWIQPLKKRDFDSTFLQIEVFSPLVFIRLLHNGDIVRCGGF